MKVLFITRGFPTDEAPMKGNYEAVQAKAIAAKGHEVGVICFYWVSFFHPFRRSRITHRTMDGVEVYECTRLKFSNKFLKLPRFDDKLKPRIFRKLFNQYVAEQGMPDVVHAHLIVTAAPTAFVKTDYQLPYVITEHWSRMFKKSIPSRLIKQVSAYHLADRVVCVSDALSGSLKNKLGVDSIVINNMVSDLFFQSRKVERNDGKYRFIACGALRNNGDKGFDILVDAFTKAQLPEYVSLDIVGDGPDRHFLQQRIDRSGLSERVRLLGVKTPEEVSQLLCQSDCFVLSSRIETFSIVVIEAMAKGLPVVATRCGGPETYLRPEHGLLIDKENAEQLAHAMRYMTEHYSDYDADRIRDFCHSHFSQDVISDKIIEVYQQVINQNNQNQKTK